MSEVPASAPITPEASTPSVFNAAETLDLEAIEILRLEQAGAIEDIRQQVIAESTVSDDVLADLKKDVVHKSIVDYLRQQGLDEADPKYESYANGLAQLSVIAVPEAIWHSAPSENPDELGQSGRDKARVVQRQLAPEEFIVQPLTPANAAPAPSAPEASPVANPEQHERLVTELKDLREKMAILSAKRQGSLLDSGIQNYDQTLELYNAKFTELARLELANDLANDTLDQTEKNALVIARYFEEQKQLRDLSKEKMANTKVDKFVKWFTSGSTLTRIGKGFLLGAGAGAVGLVAGGLAGVAGTAALAGGVVATAAAAGRFAKGYARSDAKLKRGMGDLTNDHAVQAREDIQSNPDDDIFDRVQTSLGEQLERDTKKEKQKRWKSVAMGVGAAAVGGAVATGFAVASDFMGSGSVGEWLNRADPLSDHVHNILEPDATPPELEVPPVTETPSIPEAPTLDPNFSIDSGEGGIAFFQSLGLNESQWYEVAGELRNNFPNEFYTEGYDVRIQNSGQLSIEAQQFIKNRFGL